MIFSPLKDITEETLLYQKNSQFQKLLFSINLIDKLLYRI